MKKLILVLFIAMSGQVYGQVADFFLSNSGRLKALPKDKYEMINSELTKITERFNNEVFGDTIWQSTTTERVVTGYSVDRSCVANCLLNLPNPGYADKAWCENGCTKEYVDYRTTISNRKFDINETLSTSGPEWSEIVEFYGGYSNLPSGFTKEDKSKFLITTELKYIELTGPNSCVAKIITSGDENYGLKFYNLGKSEQEVTGTYSLPKFSYSDIYNLSYRSPLWEELTNLKEKRKELLPELNNRKEKRKRLLSEFAYSHRLKTYTEAFDSETQELKKKLNELTNANALSSISFEFPENSFFEKREWQVTIDDLWNDDKNKSAREKREVMTLMLNDLVGSEDIFSEILPKLINNNNWEGIDYLLETNLISEYEILTHPLINQMKKSIVEFLSEHPFGSIGDVFDISFFNYQLFEKPSKRDRDLYNIKVDGFLPESINHELVFIECNELFKILKDRMLSEFVIMRNTEWNQNFPGEMNRKEKKNIKKIEKRINTNLKKAIKDIQAAVYFSQLNKESITGFLSIKSEWIEIVNTYSIKPGYEDIFPHFIEDNGIYSIKEFLDKAFVTVNCT